MACRTVTLPNGGLVIICGPRGRIAGCQTPGCNKIHTTLCDYPLEGPKAGTTCDRKMCDSCATSVGPDRDYCPAHARMMEPML